MAALNGSKGAANKRRWVLPLRKEVLPLGKIKKRGAGYKK